MKLLNPSLSLIDLGTTVIGWHLLYSKKVPESFLTVTRAKATYRGDKDKEQWINTRENRIVSCELMIIDNQHQWIQRLSSRMSSRCPGGSWHICGIVCSLEYGDVSSTVMLLSLCLLPPLRKLWLPLQNCFCRRRMEIPFRETELLCSRKLRLPFSTLYD